MLFYLSFILPIKAQQMELRIQSLNTTDGLPSNTVRKILQDSKGFLWFGTTNGLCRYDGNTFMNLHTQGESFTQYTSLVDDRINDLQEDSHAFLWIGTAQKRYSCYDLQNGRFVDYTGGIEPEQQSVFYKQMPNGDVWLWDTTIGGARCVKHTDNRTLTSFVLTQKNGRLPDSHIRFIENDNSGRTWIGTRKGLVTVKDNQAHTLNSSEDFRAIATRGNEVYAVTSLGNIFQYTPDEENHLTQLASLNTVNYKCKLSSAFAMKDKWLLMTDKGVLDYDFANRTITPNREMDMKNGLVKLDNLGDGWIHNYSGNVYYLQAQTGHIRKFNFMPKEKLDFIDYERYCIVHDKRDIVWISTYGNGLFAYDIHADRLEHYSTETQRNTIISSDYLQFIAEDRNGGIWISTDHAGLSRLTVSNRGVTRLFPATINHMTRLNTIRMVTPTDTEGKWLIGTYNGKVYTCDTQLRLQQVEREYPANVYAVAYDEKGVQWTGTRGHGLLIGDTWYRNDPADSTSLSKDDIFAIHRDRSGRMWIGMLEGGLNLAIPSADGKYTFRKSRSKQHGTNNVRVIAEDEKGMIWLGTSEGIYICHPDSLIAGHDGHLFSYNNHLFCSNEIRCITPDGQGGMWVGTSGAGFARCTPSADYTQLEYEQFNTKDGLVHDIVHSILTDRNGKLWIATEYGMSRFDPEHGAFRSFFFSPNMLGDSYQENSACMGADGKLMFGTDYGLTVINPDQMPVDDSMRPVVLTGLYVDGTRMMPGMADSPLDRSIAYCDQVTLKHYQNSIQLSLSVFDYEGKGQTKYKYWLENYDKTWGEPTGESTVSYKYLSPGKYHFHVKAMSGDGLWNEEETTLEIVVEPPFWQSSWAIGIYILLIIVAAYFAYHITGSFNALRTRIRVEKELTEYKLVFFTNISHEFRTPLTLIRGALEKIHAAGNTPMEISGPLQIMDKSTGRMLRLVNQLLTFRKVQNNKLALALEETDVISFLYEIYLSFGDVAEQKRMAFRFNSSVPSYKMFIDKENLDKVVYNLLSNAFKYTPAGGTVILDAIIDEETHKLCIRVTDTGVGIPREKQGELFKRFMQSSFARDSIGVGLHLTHELVIIHKGSITYSENPGGGSIFTVCLPTDKAAYDEKDFLPADNVLLKEEETEDNPADAETMPGINIHDDSLPLTAQQQAALEKITGPLNQRKVLIIEDDPDVRNFLQTEIGIYFHTETAEDGLSGLEKARTCEPDLILCDVMMPGMNGFEVTRKLKHDFDTSHLPIILLTALSSIEKQTEGIDCGADAYISKPFSIKFLLTRIFRLIEQREKLREKFTSEPGMVHTAMYTTDRDREFTERMNAVLEANIERADFSIDEFAQQMRLSRTVFYKKVKGLTGYAPVEYLRIIRMKKGAELLLSPEGLNVSEVSFRVGINDPFYFSKCFKAQFGISPSVYQKGGKDPAKEGKEENI